MGNARNNPRIAPLPPPPLRIEAPAAERLAADGLATFPLVHEDTRAGGWLVVDATGQAVELLYRPWDAPFSHDDAVVVAAFLCRRFAAGDPALRDSSPSSCDVSLTASFRGRRLMHVTYEHFPVAEDGSHTVGVWVSDEFVAFMALADDNSVLYALTVPPDSERPDSGPTPEEVAVFYRFCQRPSGRGRSRRVSRHGGGRQRHRFRRDEPRGVMAG